VPAELKPTVPSWWRWEGILGPLGRRRGLAFLTLVLALAGALALWYPHLIGQWAWGQAQRALAQDDLEAARGHLEYCARVWPTSSQTRLLLARTCRRLDDLDKARQHLRLLDPLVGQHEGVDLEWLMLQAQAGEIHQVEKTLVQHLIVGHVDEPLILEALVKGYVRSQFLGKAETWATAWIERYPDDWQAYYLRGQAYELRPLLQKAAEDYEKALELRPDHFDAHLRLGDVLYRSGLARLALPHLTYCHERRPDHADVAIKLARVYQELRQMEKMRDVLAPWIAEDKAEQTPLPRFQRALLYMLQARADLHFHGPDKALAWLRRAEKHMPREEETLVMLSTVLRELGQLEEAEKYRLLARDVHKRYQERDETVKQVRSAPDDLELRLKVARILLYLGFDEEALGWYSGILELDSQYVPALRDLANYYLERGNHELARRYNLAAEGKLRAIVEPK